MTRFFCIAAACFSLGLTGCLTKDNNTCTVTQIEPALTATGPRTIGINQTATFTLSYVPQSTCGAFTNFFEETGGAANSLNVGVRVNYPSCDCPASLAVAQTTYSFKTAQAGTYYLNFISNSATGYIVDTLVVK